MILDEQIFNLRNDLTKEEFESLVWSYDGDFDSRQSGYIYFALEYWDIWGWE